MRLANGCNAYRVWQYRHRRRWAASSTRWRARPCNFSWRGRVPGSRALCCGPRSWRRCADICRRLDGIPLALELAAAPSSRLGVHGLQAHAAPRPAGVDAGAAHGGGASSLGCGAGLELRAPEPAAALAVPATGLFKMAVTLPTLSQLVAGTELGACRLGACARAAGRHVVAGGGAGLGPERYRLLHCTRSYALAQLRDPRQCACSRGDGRLPGGVSGRPFCPPQLIGGAVSRTRTDRACHASRCIACTCPQRIAPPARGSPPARSLEGPRSSARSGTCWRARSSASSSSACAPLGSSARACSAYTRRTSGAHSRRHPGERVRPRPCQLRPRRRRSGSPGQSPCPANRGGRGCLRNAHRPRLEQLHRMFVGIAGRRACGCGQCWRRRCSAPITTPARARV